MIISSKSHLLHYGILRRSGRYPWGSGGNVVARSKTFLDVIEGLRAQGLSNTEIARGFNTPEHKFTTTNLRALTSIARAAVRQANIAEAQRLHDKGLSNIAIGKKMKINESSVRALLAPGQKDKADIIRATSDMLKDQIAEKTYIDVGVGVERHLGISKERLGTAVAALREEGYGFWYVKMPQLTNSKQTTLKVLAPPGVPYSQVYANRGKIQQPFGSTTDGGRSWFGIHPPLHVDPKRIQIRYAKEGGAEADGVIYVRPNVSDLSLGGNQYAQVRIAVGGTHFIKGMAMYKDDLPHGVDLLVNVNKEPTGNKLDALKPLKVDKTTGEIDQGNPFGSVVRQLTKEDRHGRHTVTSAMNIVNDDSDWEKWSRTLSSQFLSKQSPKLAKTQLDMLRERRQNELNEIMSLTNASVRKKLLEDFAESVDSAAVHLKAAALPRQSNHIILPVPSLKDNEIYAPSFHNGERVVLIRHPHAGPFEIPELTVNNRNREAKKLLGDAQVAVGINHKVAQKLSGADFDGDSVLVIPNSHGSVKSSPSLDRLKGFDPIAAFPKFPGMKVMTGPEKQMQMGLISNLITDMTIKRASDNELAHAVMHSMVVIDAEKHELNWKQSAIDNGISHLMEKYQGKSTGGASTLISKAKQEVRIPQRNPRSAREGGSVDRVTGQKIFAPSKNQFINEKGKTIVPTDKTTRLAEATDAHTLSSGTVIERIYADHSNALKAMANKARLEAVGTRPMERSSSSTSTYKAEVRSLDAKLNLALRNAPLERQALILANSVVSQKRAANPDMEKAELRKIKGAALKEQRLRTGAGKTRIVITDAEWAAIQAGAISPSKLSQILNNADLTRVKELATPKTKLLMTPAKIQRAQAMAISGFTQAEIAAQLGVSLTTLKNSIR